MIDFVIRNAEGDVPNETVVEKKNFLWDIADPQLPFQWHRLAERFAINQNFALGRLIETKKDVNQS